MDTQQLEKALKKTKFFRGVFARDQLPKQVGKRPALFICNTDNASAPGEHWVAIYRTVEGQDELFDSLCLSQKLFKHFLKKKFVTNVFPVQSPFSKTCGYHVLFFAYHRSRGKTFRDIMHRYSLNLRTNDFMVQNFVRKNFKIKKSLL